MMSRSNWLPLKSIIVVSLSEYFLEGYPVSAESKTLRQSRLKCREKHSTNTPGEDSQGAVLQLTLAYLARLVWSINKVEMSPHSTIGLSLGLARQAQGQPRKGGIMTRKYIDCREFPSEMNCTVALCAAAVQHAVAVHKHQDTPELRQQIKQLFKDGTPPAELPRQAA
jgi:hypothetical protein